MSQVNSSTVLFKILIQPLFSCHWTEPAFIRCNVRWRNFTACGWLAGASRWACRAKPLSDLLPLCALIMFLHYAVNTNSVVLLLVSISNQQPSSTLADRNTLFLNKACTVKHLQECVLRKTINLQDSCTSVSFSQDSLYWSLIIIIIWMFNSRVRKVRMCHRNIMDYSAAVIHGQSYMWQLLMELGISGQVRY